MCIHYKTGAFLFLSEQGQWTSLPGVRGIRQRFPSRLLGPLQRREIILDKFEFRRTVKRASLWTKIVNKLGELVLSGRCKPCLRSRVHGSGCTRLPNAASRQTVREDYHGHHLRR